MSKREESLLNLNYYYKRGYYKWLQKAKISDTDVNTANQIMVNMCFKNSDETIEFCEKGQCFPLTTVYPGLMTGLGDLHMTQHHKEEFKLGFSLDYTTGMPYIPASGIKGMLRSVFLYYPEYVMEYCDSITRFSERIVDMGLENKIEHVVREIELEIFKGSSDVFFTAVPFATASAQLFGIDYITPHKAKIAEMEGLRSPDVIKMLKVIPGVSYVFRFRLQDGAILKKEEKLELFRQILLDFGIGAKTNVGFGILKECEEKSVYYHLKETAMVHQKNKDKATVPVNKHEDHYTKTLGR